MRSTLVTLLAVVASVLITACGTPALTDQEKAERAERRRNSPPTSNCRFENCQVYEINPPARAASKPKQGS